MDPFSSIEAIPTPRIRVAVAIVQSGALLLVRHQKGQRSYWLLPGGGVEYGEPAKDAARREMLEETGLEVDVGSLLLVSETVAPDGSRHLIHLVFAGRQTGGALVLGDDPRVAEVRFVPLEEVPELVLHPPFADQLLAALEGRLTDQDRFLGRLWID